MKTLYDLKIEEYEKEVNKIYSGKEEEENCKEQRRRHLIKLFRKRRICENKCQA